MASGAGQSAGAPPDFDSPSGTGNGGGKSFPGGSNGDGSARYFDVDSELRARVRTLENNMHEMRGTMSGLATKADVESRPSRGEFWGAVAFMIGAVALLGWLT